MGCNNCTININQDTKVKGCKNNGHCSSGSCNKFSVFDWLSNISSSLGDRKFDCVEVNFKNGRKGFYRNTLQLPLYIGDNVIVEADKGYDLGTVSLTGELVRVQMQKKRVNHTDISLLQVSRKANEQEYALLQECRSKEIHLQTRTREIAMDLGLQMKLSDVEFQADGTKATFYYTADDRIDFRQLIKVMGNEFGIRIEMKQISERQEASRLGGIGSCGRELCCSVWLTDLKKVKVSTAAARYQQLSLNMEKLAGQCGKLKCCLNFELDVYMDALKDFPKTDTQIQTENGVAVCQKVDIFKKIMWFSYRDGLRTLYKLTVDQVKDILEINKEGKLISSIEEYSQVHQQKPDQSAIQIVEFDSITRFDKPKKSKKKKKIEPKKKIDFIEKNVENKKIVTNKPQEEINSIKKKNIRRKPKRIIPKNNEIS